MIDKMGKDIGKTTRWSILQDLSRKGIKILTTTRALEITKTGIQVETDDQANEIPADTIVLAVGVSSNNPLQAVLEKKGLPFQVAGDAGRVGLAFDAVHQGFAAGRKIE
jgi:2,4-dienoyl-CoA reductase (NADPH2)